MIAVRYDNATGLGDLAGYAEGALQKDEGLETAILISLFLNRRALPGDPVPEGADLGGWWGDSYPDVQGDQIGSRLWLLDGQKTTDENLRRAEAYAVEALQWMIADGIAAEVSATAERIIVAPAHNRLKLTIEIQRPDGLTDPWLYVWDVTLGALATTEPGGG